MAVTILALAVCGAAVGSLSARATTQSSDAFACPAGEASEKPPPHVPRYTLAVHIQKGLRLVNGTLSVVFAPETATDRLVFRLWPNEPFLARKGARLTVTSLRVRGQKASAARSDPTMLIVQRPIARAESVVISMKWRLRLPRGSVDRLYGGALARLGSFFPLLAWNPREGWQTDPPSAIGWETWTSPTADFDVRVTAPRGLRVLASGAEVSRGHWRASRIRDFAIAVGHFRVMTGVASAPNAFRMTVGLERGSPALAQRLLADTRAALESHARRFGPYPWGTFTTVASRMDRFSFEYPTLIFQSANDPDLSRGVAHEVGHQWFYSLVGNNQARDPWLDETLATWAQARLSNDIDDLAAKSIPDGVRNQLGQPMTFWDRFGVPVFIDGAYTQGVQALASLGDPDAVDCALRRYAFQNAYAIAAPDDLLQALQVFFPDARPKLEAYGARF